MNLDLPVVLSIIGGIFLLLAIVGGGIGGSITTPTISQPMRFVSGGIGAVLITVALFDYYSSRTARQLSESLTSTPTQASLGASTTVALDIPTTTSPTRQPPTSVSSTSTQQATKEPTIALPTVQPAPEPTYNTPSIDWPSTPEAAAQLFAGGKGNWEMIGSTGWHLKDLWPPIKVTVPVGIVMEGFSDKGTPSTRRCMVVLGFGEDTVQGATFWLPDDPDNPIETVRRVYSLQTAWPADKGPTKCEAIGFQP